MLAAAMASAMGIARAEYPLNWEAATIVNAGSNEFAPYYIASNRAGTVTQAAGVYEYGKLWRPLSKERRFDYSFGAEAWVGIADDVTYSKYSLSAGAFVPNKQRPAIVWLQQLWGEVKYRSLFLYAGMKENDRSLFDSPLGIGDITLSNNARPIPQVRAGFIDFQNVPFTKGWLQVRGEIAYGKFADNKWLENHYNYYNYYLTTGRWFHYKNIYLRSNPNARFSAMIGFQHAAQFGGTQTFYDKGVMGRRNHTKVRFKDFIDVFVQKRGGSGGTAGDQLYYNGDHLGSWDLRFTYRFNDSSTLTAFVQAPWNDGSGIGKLNGWDGVWGLEYKSGARHGWITGAQVEYFDFTNQSGPEHWAPGDYPGTTIPGDATGADDYYNNFFYNGWENNGMAIGSPILKSPIYNTDGYMLFTDNRIRGFQAGVTGSPSASWSYRAMVSWRRSWGTPFVPRARTADETSAMVEATHNFPAVKGLWLTGAVAFDAGKLYDKTHVGVLVTLGYTGNFSLSK